MTRLRLVPTEVAAAALGVKPGTIRQHAARGRLTRYGTPTARLYDLDELAALKLGPEREDEFTNKDVYQVDALTMLGQLLNLFVEQEGRLGQPRIRTSWVDMQTYQTWRHQLAEHRAAAARCGACDHLAADHGPEGCARTVRTDTGPGPECACTVPGNPTTRKARQ